MVARMIGFDILKQMQSNKKVVGVKKDIGIKEGAKVFNKWNMLRFAANAVVGEGGKAMNNFERDFERVVNSKNPSNNFFINDNGYSVANDSTKFASPRYGSGFSPISRERFESGAIGRIQRFENNYDLIDDKSESKMLKWLKTSNYSDLRKGLDAKLDVQNILFGGKK